MPPRLDPPVPPVPVMLAALLEALPPRVIVVCKLCLVVCPEVLCTDPARPGPVVTAALSRTRWLGAGVVSLAPWKLADPGFRMAPVAAVRDAPMVLRIVPVLVLIPPRVVLMVVRVLVSMVPVVLRLDLVPIPVLLVVCLVVVRRLLKVPVVVVLWVPPVLCLLMVVPSECS